MISTHRIPRIAAFTILAIVPFHAVVADLKDTISPLIEAHDGEVAVAIRHLDNGESFQHRGNTPMPTASLIKLAVMAEAYRQAESGQLDLDTLLTLDEKDKVPGSGILTQHFTSGTRISLRDAIRLMIVYSDNTATNLVLDQIGMRSTAEFMEQLGFNDTKIHSKVFRGSSSVFPERSKEFGLGSTTAEETVRLLEKLHQKELVSPAASEEMLEHLYLCDDDTKLTRFLPAETKIAHKTGAVSRARTAGGIIYSPEGPIAICVLTNENVDRSWKTDNAGNRLCAAIARAAYRHFNPPANARTGDSAKSEEQSAPLAEGASGRLVESLQRTLNARLEPPPELSVDGEFGPITKAAVIRFQQQKEVEATGRVGPETWKALGALVTRDPPVKAPDVINAQKLERNAADSLSGPPFVTCKAYAIADVNGNVIWSQRADAPLDIASTTKIMTAYLVVLYASKNPEALDERLTFSSRAADTIGSTCGLRAGESLTVRECLYGLLLPSGNDASVALAEHFGARLADEQYLTDDAQGHEQEDRLALFVDAMNRAAKALGMTDTTFRNPHGLTQSGHRSTANDLVRLAQAALEFKLFHQVVQVRQRGCTVTGPGGYQRNVVWKNTNRLLATEGYSGIKTGTTNAAGACLVSRAKRGDDELILVVLGSKSSDARYVDSRNLYRWAWQQRGHGD